MKSKRQVFVIASVVVSGFLTGGVVCAQEAHQASTNAIPISAPSVAAATVAPADGLQPDGNGLKNVDTLRKELADEKAARAKDIADLKQQFAQALAQKAPVSQPTLDDQVNSIRGAYAKVRETAVGLACAKEKDGRMLFLIDATGSVSGTCLAAAKAP